MVTSNGVPIVFSHVDREGTTSVMIYDRGPKLPNGMTVLLPFYKIRTTAKDSGPVYIYLPYDQEYLPKGAQVHMLRFIGKERRWEDITHSTSKRDKLLCGRCSGLSTFAVARTSAV